MAHTRLFTFLEGGDDARFFDRIIIPRLTDSYDSVHVVQYAQLSVKKVDAIIRTTAHIPDAEYLFFGDMNGSPCISDRKGRLSRAFASLAADRTYVVVQEIESWYLAGVPADACKRLGIKREPRTDNVTKEDFDRAVLTPRHVRIERLSEILDAFDLPLARTRNGSFDYAVTKLGFA